MSVCVQPEQIKVPVQCHDGEEDAMEGLADPKVTYSVTPCCTLSFHDVEHSPVWKLYCNAIHTKQ